MRKSFYSFFIAVVLCWSLSAFSTFAQKSIMGDTVVTKDPLNTNREYWEIRNGAGGIMSQGFMLNGKKDGVWREYSEGNGKLSKIEEYSNGIRNGASLTVHINGSITSDVTYLDDKLDGQRTTMSNYGNVKMMENYKKGILEGHKKMFYDDGHIQEDGIFKNGQRVGLTKWYRGDGTPSLEYTYDNGTIQGPAKEYDEKGRIKKSGQYVNNNENGEWQEYQDSVLVKKIIYKDGKIMKEVPVKK